MTISAPLVDVLMADGTVHEKVKLTIQDQLKLSTTARRRNWDVEDPILGPIFMAWHSLNRRGIYTGTWDAFQDECEWVDAPKADDEAEVADEGDPTP